MRAAVEMTMRLQDSRFAVHQRLRLLWNRSACDDVVGRIIWARLAPDLRHHLRRSAEAVSTRPVGELDEQRAQLLALVDELSRDASVGKLDRVALGSLIFAWRRYTVLETRVLARAVQLADLANVAG